MWHAGCEPVILQRIPECTELCPNSGFRFAFYSAVRFISRCVFFYIFILQFAFYFALRMYKYPTDLFNKESPLRS